MSIIVAACLMCTCGRVPEPPDADTLLAFMPPELEHGVNPDSTVVLPVEQSAQAWPAATLETVFDTPPALPFARIGGVAMTGSGGFAVLDEGGSWLHLFDARGGHLRTVGGRGDGPGEMRRARGLSVHDDTIHVLSDNLDAFTGDGRHIRTLRHLRPVLSFSNAVFATDSGIVVRTYSYQLRSAGPAWDRARLVRVPDSATFQVTRAVTATRKHTTRAATLLAPMAVQVLPVASPEGRLFRVIGDSLHIEEWSPDGHFRTRITSPIRRTPTTDADFRMAVRGMEYLLLSNPFREDPRSALPILRFYRSLPKPEHRPIIGGMLAGAHGALLIARLDLAEHPYSYQDTTHTMPWMLLRDHIVSRRIRLPMRFTPMVLEACGVTGVFRGRDDVESVRRYTWSAHTDPGCGSSPVRPPASP